MPAERFIKLHENMYYHHKWVSLRPSAQALWVNVLLWCGLNRQTQGRIHRSVLRGMVRDCYSIEELEVDAAALHGVVALEETNSADWLLAHDWREWQPNFGSGTVCSADMGEDGAEDDGAEDDGADREFEPAVPSGKTEPALPASDGSGKRSGRTGKSQRPDSELTPAELKARYAARSRWAPKRTQSAHVEHAKARSNSGVEHVEHTAGACQKFQKLGVEHVEHTPSIHPGHARLCENLESSMSSIHAGACQKFQKLGVEHVEHTPSIHPGHARLCENLESSMSSIHAGMLGSAGFEGVGGEIRDRDQEKDTEKDRERERARACAEHAGEHAASMHGEHARACSEHAPVHAKPQTLSPEPAVRTEGQQHSESGAEVAEQATAQQDATPVEAVFVPSFAEHVRSAPAIGMLAANSQAKAAVGAEGESMAARMTIGASVTQPAFSRAASQVSGPMPLAIVATPSMASGDLTPEQPVLSEEVQKETSREVIPCRPALPEVSTGPITVNAPAAAAKTASKSATSIAWPKKPACPVDDRAGFERNADAVLRVLQDEAELLGDDGLEELAWKIEHKIATCGLGNATSRVPRQQLTIEGVDWARSKAAEAKDNGRPQGHEVIRSEALRKVGLVLKDYCKDPRKLPPKAAPETTTVSAEDAGVVDNDPPELDPPASTPGERIVEQLFRYRDLAEKGPFFDAAKRSAKELDNWAKCQCDTFEIWPHVHQAMGKLSMKLARDPSMEPLSALGWVTSAAMGMFEEDPTAKTWGYTPVHRPKQPVSEASGTVVAAAASTSPSRPVMVPKESDKESVLQAELRKAIDKAAASGDTKRAAELAESLRASILKSQEGRLSPAERHQATEATKQREAAREREKAEENKGLGEALKKAGIDVRTADPATMGPKPDFAAKPAAATAAPRRGGPPRY